MSILAWLVVGLIAGFLASKVINKTGSGLIMDIVLGVVGALLGGWLWGVLSGADVTLGFNLPSLLIAVLGAVVLIGLSRLISGRRVSGTA